MIEVPAAANATVDGPEPIHALAAPSSGSPRAASSASSRFPLLVISSCRNAARGNAR